MSDNLIGIFMRHEDIERWLGELWNGSHSVDLKDERIQDLIRSAKQWAAARHKP